MLCRGMLSAFTLPGNFIPYDRFSANLQRKFILTASITSKQVFIDQMQSKSTDAKVRPQTYINKLFLKSESHYRIKEKPTNF